MKRIRNIKVTNITQLSPNMKRITFHSKDFIDFPEDEDGDMLNFCLNKNHQTTPF